MVITHLALRTTTFGDDVLEAAESRLSLLTNSPFVELQR
jgi:hypothetical protein